MDPRRRVAPAQPANAHQRRLPEKIDLTRHMPPSRHQLTTDTSAANAFAIVLEYWVKRKKNQDQSASRLFLDYNGRQEQRRDSKNPNGSVSIQHVVNALRRYGVCDEKYWPYRAELINKQPSKQAYEHARSKVVDPVPVRLNMEHIKGALANKLPVIVEGSLSQSPRQESVENSFAAFVNNPSKNHSRKHVAIFAGYDDQKQIFIVRDLTANQSNGSVYSQLPYAYFSEGNQMNPNSSGWTVREIRGRVDPKPPANIGNIAHNRGEQQPPRERIRKP